MEYLRCLVTKNRCGTDTWSIGKPCMCDNCMHYMWQLRMDKILAGVFKSAFTVDDDGRRAA